MLFLRIITVSRIVSNCNRTVPIVNTSFHRINTLRLLSNDQSKASKKSIKKEKERLRTYVLEKYMKYVQNYTLLLEKKFPAAMKMYRVFSVGIKDFYNDLKTYITLRIKVGRDQGFSNISRQDIELYQKMPSDMWRIAPVLILSAIPFGNYVIFPLALALNMLQIIPKTNRHKMSVSDFPSVIHSHYIVFLKPRTLLCSHFWSIQQRAEFSILELKERLKHNRPVFRALQAKLNSVSDEVVKAKWLQIIAQLGSGVHPSPQDVVMCKEIFTKEPYHLNHISYAHAGHLLKMHGLRKGIFRKNKLRYRAFLLQEMDKAIIREGGVETLGTESLRNACHIRGLNSSHLSNQDMMAWLQNWLQVSRIVDKNSYSLLLHSPIFFAYNHPQNWMLIY